MDTGDTAALFIDPRSEAEIILIQLTDVRSDQAAPSLAGPGWAG